MSQMFVCTRIVHNTPNFIIYRLVSLLEFNVPFQHKYGYIGDDIIYRSISMKLYDTFDAIFFGNIPL